MFTKRDVSLQVDAGLGGAEKMTAILMQGSSGIRSAEGEMGIT